MAKQDFRGLLSSLLVQLCAKSDPCHEVLSRLYFTYDKGSRLPDDKALVQCLKDMLGLPEQPTVYLIVDALDECHGTSGVVSARDRVLELIEDLVGLVVESNLPNLRMCITSRPEADIREALEPLASHTVSLHDEDGQKQDIIDYVTFVVHSDRKMRRWSAEDKRLVIDTISERADGMFQWVFCQLGALRRRIPGTIERALKELPQTLDETYERILLGIDEDSQEYARCLFQCLCVSIRPLRLAELAEVLLVHFDTRGDSEDHIDWRSEGAQQALLSACLSLVTVANIDGSPVVQFTHFSVREYLTSDRLANARKHLSRYHVLPHSAHTILARASLGVLLSLDRHVGKEAAEEHPLAIYGARHWIDHAKFGTVSLDIQDLTERLFDRSRPHFAAWVWIYDFDRPLGGQMATTHPEQPKASPLYYAALCGFPDIAERLAVTHPGHVNAKGGHYVTPLYAALTNREFDAARALLRHGADINSPGMNGFSPLHSASLGGDRDAVQLLLEHQADINVKKYITESEHTLAYTPLYFSALTGQLEICRLLLEHGADVDAKRRGVESPLQAASRGKHLRVLKLLLDSGASDFPDSKGQTALIAASRRGDAEVVRILIESDADVASRNSKMSTSLDLASQDGHLDLVRFLLVNGADPNRPEGGFNTPLHFASSAGYLEIVQLLIRHGSDLDNANRLQQTPLHLALRYGHLQVARFIIEHRANITSKDRDGQTALHDASRHGAVDIIELLLDGGVDVNVRNKNGKTPLHLASGDGRTDAADFLIERGADVNVRDTHLSSPLHDASADGDLDVATLLLDRGADVDMQNSSRETPLHRASGNGKLEVAKLLVERGADVDKQNSSQETPLHRASGDGRLEVARFLIKRGSNVGTKDRDGRTSLHAAAKGGYLDVVEMLLEMGADIDVRDSRNKSLFNVAPRFWADEVASTLVERFVPSEILNPWHGNRKTPLHEASEEGRLEIARLLVDSGADVNCRDEQGHTPLDLSSQSEHLDVARFLLDRGAHVDTICQNHITALHNASSQGYLEIVRLLIDRGANVNALGHNGSGFTPLQGARLNQKHEVIQLLTEHGAT